MDWHKLQHTLFKLDPTDPREDLARLQQSAGKSADNIPTIDYINESVEVPVGSMPLNINSVSDFAKLAGIQTKQIVNEDDDKPPRGFAQGFQAVQKGGVWGPDVRSNIIGKALTPGDSDKNKTSNQTNKIPRGLVPPELQGHFKAAITLIKQDQKVTNDKQHAALASAFRTLLNNPKNAQRLLTQLTDDIDQESIIQQPKEHSQEKHNNKQYESIKEELYRRLNANK
jgi:hypothetical protein